MGNVCVKDEQSPFCSTAAPSSSRPRAVQDDARGSSQGRPFRTAAQRLGLELSEHVILLGPSGTTGTPRVSGRSGHLHPALMQSSRSTICFRFKPLDLDRMRDAMPDHNTRSSCRARRTKQDDVLAQLKAKPLARRS